MFGDNGDGQLGLGDNTNRNIPTTLGSLGGTPVQLALGNLHSCAVLDTSETKCWGWNVRPLPSAAAVASVCLLATGCCGPAVAPARQKVYM